MFFNTFNWRLKPCAPNYSTNDTSGAEGGHKLKDAMATPELGSTASSLPAEILGKIFHDMLDSFDSAEKHLYSADNAQALLKISRVSSYFREVVISDPSLWAKAPYINGIHEDFLPIILSRSEHCTLELSFMEDESLAKNPQLRSQITSHFKRVSRLQVELAVAYEGSVLQSLLSTSAQSLIECTILLLGDRNVPLEFFNGRVLGPFDNHAPILRSLNLVNCYLPPMHYSSFPSLSDISIQYIGDQLLQDALPFMPAGDLFRWPAGFKYLRTLTLFNCIERPAFVALGASQVPVALPSLRCFILETSTEGCQHFAHALQLPTSCSRSITIIFPQERQGLEDAYSAAHAASLFIPLDVRYKQCSVGTPSDPPYFRLIADRMVATLRFKLSQVHLDELPEPVHLLIRMLCFPQTSSLTAKHIFLYQIWTAITSALTKPLSTIPILNLWFGKDSLAPCLLLELIQAMSRMEEVVFRTNDLLAHPSIQACLDRDNAPTLNKLEIPLDNESENLKVKATLTEFLHHRREVKGVTFRVRDSTLAGLGYAAPDAIRNMIRNISEDFPNFVFVTWIRY
ncbi:hypothetical protein D9611_001701 [Ephemerocybe angulata]|uniref:F-box domain-containing protein n=1 Tax=Ephemerocybe angulata TaxID=980116 RepID=A0A8H5FMF7_9AGAR|nr:hypothetical protein D9611_001701 [Tulosesus angulatus]